MWKLLLVISSFCIYNSKGDICKNPEITSTSYTTKDGVTIVETAFVVEFSLKCSGGEVQSTLYAEIDGKILPVTRSIENNDKYFVSWTDEAENSRSKQYNINLYDEEGYSALRKVLLMGDDFDSIKPLLTIPLHYSGAYRGPWVKSEFLAVSIGIGIWYFAFTCKSKL